MGGTATRYSSHRDLRSHSFRVSDAVYSTSARRITLVLVTQLAVGGGGSPEEEVVEVTKFPSPPLEKHTMRWLLLRVSRTGWGRKYKTFEVREEE